MEGKRKWDVVDDMRVGVLTRSNLLLLALAIMLLLLDTGDNLDWTDFGDELVVVRKVMLEVLGAVEEMDCLLLLLLVTLLLLLLLLLWCRGVVFVGY